MNAERAPVKGPGYIWTKEVGYDLPDEAYTDPRMYEQVTDSKMFREVMLNRNGKILAAGAHWKIMGQDLGHGLVRVTLVRENYA